MKAVRFFIYFLHLFIGIGAVAGGLGAVMTPIGPMGVSPEALEHSPFETFLVPGLFLFIIIGLGNILSFVVSRFFREAGGYLSGLMGIILCLWIIIQCVFLRAIGALHVIFFILGVIQGFLALKLLFAGRQWPYYDIVFFFARRADEKKLRLTVRSK